MALINQTGLLPRLLRLRATRRTGQAQALAARAAELAALHSPSSRTIGVDFDGVLHDDHDGWRGGELYGDAFPGAIEKLEALHAAGWHLMILTARHRRFHEDIATWLRKHITPEVIVDDYDPERAYWHGPAVLVTNRKLGALAYLDDKGERFTSWHTALEGLPSAPGPTASPPAGRRQRRLLLQPLDRGPSCTDPALLTHRLRHEQARVRDRRIMQVERGTWRLHDPIDFQPELLGVAVTAADVTARLDALASIAAANLNLSLPSHQVLHKRLIAAARASRALEEHTVGAAAHTTDNGWPTPVDLDHPSDRKDR